MSLIYEHLKKMRHSGLRNYIVPGLDSYLIGGEGKGRVRMFHCNRQQQEFITPHSHRFDFACLVLSGSVTNIVYEPTVSAYHGTCYTLTALRRGAEMGEYTRHRLTEKFYRQQVTHYAAGEEYGMRADQVHSIAFAEGTRVLFFEGPEVKQESFVLEPYVNGKTVPTFRVEPWMFERMEDE